MWPSRVVSPYYFVRISGDTKEEGKLAAFGLFNNAKSVPTSVVRPLQFQVAYENSMCIESLRAHHSFVSIRKASKSS